MSKLIRIGLTLVLAVQCVSCSTLNPKPLEAVDPAKVINAVKDELNFVAYYLEAHPIQRPKVDPNVPSTPGVNCSADSAETVAIKPSYAKLTLKAVATRENDSTAQLVNPIGILKINAGYKGAYSKSKAQTIEFDFDLVNEKSYGVTKPQSKALEDHPLTQALYASLQQLASVNHKIGPCFYQPTLKVTLNFDVLSKSTLGGDITLVVFKLGDQETISNEFQQTLEFDFMLPDQYFKFKLK